MVNFQNGCHRRTLFYLILLESVLVDTFYDNYKIKLVFCFWFM